MSFKLTLREQRARAALRAWRIDEPTSEDWEEALKLVDNTATQERPKASDYVGSYGLAKQDQVPYKPMLRVGPPSSEGDSEKLVYISPGQAAGSSQGDIRKNIKKDPLMEWLINQPNQYRK